MLLVPKRFFALIGSFPVYQEANSESETYYPLLGALTQMAEDNIGVIHTIRSRGIKVVAENKNEIFLFAISASDEPKKFLAQQLNFLHDVLLLRVGALNLTLKRASRLTGNVFSRLRQIVAFYSNLCDTMQNFMLQELEWLDLNEGARAPVRDLVQDVLRRNRHIAHAMLVVNSKVIVYERTATAHPLSATELMIFVVYSCALLGIKASATDSKSSDEAAAPVTIGRPMMDSVFLNAGTVPHYVAFCPLSADVALITLSPKDAGQLAREAVADTSRALGEELMTQATAVQQRLLAAAEPFLDFFAFKSSRNFPLHDFIDVLPGLVQFVFVDRTNHHVVSPQFDPLSGSALGPDVARADQDAIRAAVRDMVLSLLEPSASHNACTLRTGRYLYMFRRWAEDTTGAEVPLDAPGVRVARRCELYMMFVAVTSAAAAEAQSLQLIQRLHEIDGTGELKEQESRRSALA